MISDNKINLDISFSKENRICEFVIISNKYKLKYKIRPKLVINCPYNSFIKYDLKSFIKILEGKKNTYINSVYLEGNEISVKMKYDETFNFIFYSKIGKNKIIIDFEKNKEQIIKKLKQFYEQYEREKIY